MMDPIVDLIHKRVAKLRKLNKKLSQEKPYYYIGKIDDNNIRINELNELLGMVDSLNKKGE